MAYITQDKQTKRACHQEDEMSSRATDPVLWQPAIIVNYTLESLLHRIRIGLVSNLDFAIRVLIKLDIVSAIKTSMIQNKQRCRESSATSRKERKKSANIFRTTINNIPWVDVLSGQNNIFLNHGLLPSSTREIGKLFLDYIWAELVPLQPFSLSLRWVRGHFSLALNFLAQNKC